MTNDQDAAMANAEKRSSLPQVKPAPMLTGAGLVGVGGQRVVTRRGFRAADAQVLPFDGGGPPAMGDSVEDGRGPVLIVTKLCPPVVRDQIVPRERLTEPLRTRTAGTSFGPGLLPRPGLDQALATAKVHHLLSEQVKADGAEIWGN